MHEGHLRSLTTHEVGIVLHGERVGLGQIVVALVDDLIVGRTVEEVAFAILKVGEAGNGGNGVRDILRGGDEVAAELSEKNILLYHPLEVGENTEIEIDGIRSGESSGIAVHVRRQHILTRRGDSSETKEGEAE